MLRAPVSVLSMVEVYYIDNVLVGFVCYTTDQ